MQEYKISEGIYNINFLIIRHYAVRKFGCKHLTQDEKQVFMSQLISSFIEQKNQQFSTCINPKIHLAKIANNDYANFWEVKEVYHGNCTSKE